MQKGLAKVIKWDGLEGLMETEYGDVIRFTTSDIHPHDLDKLCIGTIINITDHGYLELTSETFYYYLDEKFDGKACVHKFVKGICIACGETVNLED